MAIFWKSRVLLYSAVHLYIMCLLLFVNNVELHGIQYVSRFRNFSVSSETNSARLLNMSIFQFKMEHRLAVTFEVLKDINVKYIQITIYRCTLDRFQCENFQIWKIRDNIRNFVYMKNQLWTPAIVSLNPKLDFPHMRKGIYYMPNISLSGDKIVAFYSEAPKFFFRVAGASVNKERKMEITFHYEFLIFEYVERNRNNGTKMR